MSEAPAPVSRRQWMHGLLTREEGGLAGRALRAGLVVQIIVSVAAAMLKTVPEIGRSYALALDSILLLSTLGFAIEYALRIWIAPEDGGNASPIQARLRYMRSAPGLVDLIAAIPFALGSYVGLNLDWLDIMPIFKLLRHTAAFHLLVEAVYAERRVLGSAAILMVALLVFFSSLVYYLEREAQPKAFSSIPAALWWGIITLTTVGYGDMTPVTAWGKFFGGITTIFGLCMFAIPVGIIASAFIEAVRRREFVDTWNLVAKVPLVRALDAARMAAMVALPPGKLAASAEEPGFANAVAALEQAGKRREARDSYRALVQRWPTSLIGLIGLGNTEYALGDLAAAESALRRAGQAHRDSAIAFNNHAHVLAALGRLSDAEAAARHALSLGGPLQPEVQKTLDAILARRGVKPKPQP